MSKSLEGQNKCVVFLAQDQHDQDAIPQIASLPYCFPIEILILLDYLRKCHVEQTQTGIIASVIHRTYD